MRDRYAIERGLGRGGNAVVYLAHDIKHDRKVALKVLLPELALAVRTERFFREIRIAAKLTHPHILPLYDSGETGGVLYYVMPYVEGESLRDRLNREKQLPVDDALSITRDVAAALGHAHAYGVVHRDIKPENILLTRDGKPVVMDFGIARALMVAGGETVTESGIAVGTPAYMSPEQSSAGELDARSDIYSLGCVLYEMLTGHPPFTGSTAQEILGRHALDPVPTVRAVRPNLPGAIEQTIEKALAKHPADRFATASQFAEALRTSGRGVRSRRRTLAYSILVLAILLGGAVVASRALRPAGGRPTEQSIAVLPFVNLSTDPENEYFSDGMTDDVINALTQVEGLRVPARTSSFTFKGKNVEIVEVGRRLSVANVLEGTVRRVGGQLRVTAQLVSARDGHNLWSQQYDRALQSAKDVFAVQDEISRDIVSALRVRLAGGAAARLVPRSTENLAAYDDYLRGRHFWNGQTRDDMRKAIDYFRSAIAQDSGFALAWSGLADAYVVAGGASNYLPRERASQQAKAAALKALALDETLAEAHTSVARVRVNYDGDWSGAEAEYRRAIALGPRYALAHSWLAELLGNLGQSDQAIAEARLGLEMDPLSSFATRTLGRVYLFSRQYDSATRYLRQAVDLQPDVGQARQNLGMAYMFQGMFPEALAEFEEELRVRGNTGAALARIGVVYVQQGRREEAVKILRQMHERSKEEQVAAVSFAILYGWLGDNTQAIEWLERALADRLRNTGVNQVRNSPLYDPLRSDPRFQALLKKMGLDK